MTRRRRLLKNFEDAVRGDEMKGSRHPLETEWYESNYWIAKTELQIELGILRLGPILTKRLQKAKDELDSLLPTDQEVEEWDT